MGIIKKVAVVGAMAAVGALAANRKAIKKAVRNMIGSGKDAMHTVTDKADELAARADKSLAGEKKVARVAKKVGAKKPRAARRAARRAVHAAT